MHRLVSAADGAQSLPAQVSAFKMRTEGLSKNYGSTVALHPIDLEVKTGELLTLLGPSGSGKTTLAANYLRTGRTDHGQAVHRCARSYPGARA